MTKKWEIQEWNCDKQQFGAPITVTLAEYRAKVDAATAQARAIHAANVAKMAKR